ncbi:MAG: glycosyltransferase family 2 protein [Prevotella sp.]|nr:glycosyltransferase family 2 protein [Prevotella sp.]
MKRLSIIIVTYNSERDIYDCLTAIDSYSDLPREELELIIVDNQSRSPQPMFEKIREIWGSDSDIILIENDRNGGYGQGNNVGIRLATAPVVMIMNPDVRLMEPVFKTALKAFDDDEKLIMYGMKQMLSADIKSPLSFDCISRMNGYLSTLLTTLCNRIDCYLPHYMYFSGSCFFIRKKNFEDIGLFDEDLFLYGEEDDIHERLSRRYGPHFFYNRHLHYIHLALNRIPTLDLEQKMLQSIIRSNEKKGYPARRIFTNRLQNTHIRYWREWLRVKRGKGNKELLETLKQFRQILKTQISNT